MFKTKAALASLLTLALLGCSGDGTIIDQGVVVTRSACPAVAIPAATGDVTLFDPANSRDAAAIDVVATITNVRATCDESGEYILSNVSFDVIGQRRDAAGAREVVLPYFVVAVQGGNNVVSKRVSRVALQFADGQISARTSGSASGQILRSAATLPEAIREQITRPRKAGEVEAAIDPMADPAVRAAVVRATFEMLVGFQLTDEQLRYNATR